MKCAAATGSSFPLPQPKGGGAVASSGGFAGAIDALLSTAAPASLAPVPAPTTSMTPQLVAQTAPCDDAPGGSGPADIPAAPASLPSPGVPAVQDAATPTPASSAGADKTVLPKESPLLAQPTIASRSDADATATSSEVPSPIRRGDDPAAAGQRPTVGKRPRHETAALPTEATSGAIAGNAPASDASLMTAAFVPAAVIAADATTASPERAGAQDAASGTTRASATGGAGQARLDPAPPGGPQPATTDAVAVTPEARAATVAPVGIAVPDVASAPIAPAPTAALAAHANAASSSATEPHVAARAGQIGHDVGVAIARRVSDGGDELVVRLMPAELGRIEVRMAFDARGGLRAVIAADSLVALDMLRRDSADLSRALTDAGVRSDANTLTFQTDGGSQNGTGQPRSPWLDAGRKPARAADGGSFAEDVEPLPYRQVRTSGRYDLMA